MYYNGKGRFMASVVLQVRVSDKLKRETGEIFGNLGLSMSDAVRLFLNRVAVEQGLPFPMKLNAPKANFDPLGFPGSYEEKKGGESKAESGFDPARFLDEYIEKSAALGG